MRVNFDLTKLPDAMLDLFLSSVLKNAPAHKLHQAVDNALLSEKFRRSRMRAGKPEEPEVTLTIPILPLVELEQASVGLALSIAALEIKTVEAEGDTTRQSELAVALEFLHAVLASVKAEHAMLGDMGSSQVN